MRVLVRLKFSKALAPTDWEVAPSLSIVRGLDYVKKSHLDGSVGKRRAVESNETSHE